jgi:predicted nucleotidyltransferase
VSHENDPVSSLDALCAGVARACEQVSAVRVAYLFGSQISGHPRPDSDLDVAVELGHALAAAERGAAKLQLIAALTDELGRLGERADVVDLRHCDPAVAFRVISLGKLVKAIQPTEQVRLEARIARAYDDDAPRREVFRRAAIRAAQRMGKDAGHG